MSNARLDVAARALRGRNDLPPDAASWGRSFGLMPGESLRLVTAEAARRTRTKETENAR